MVRKFIKIIAIELSLLFVLCFFGCAERNLISVNGYPDAISFKAYTIYGSGVFSEYVSSREEPWTDDSVEKNKTLKLDGNKIKLVYESTVMKQLCVYDKFVMEENSDVEICFYNRTDEIYKVEFVVSSDEKNTTPFPKCSDMLQKDSYESYVKSIFEFLGYDISDKVPRYTTHYSEVNGSVSSGNTVDEFFIPAEKDRLGTIEAWYESGEQGDDKFDYTFRVSYDDERNAKSIRIMCNLVLPKERFALSEEDAMKVILKGLDEQKKAILELVDGTYTIVYEDGYKRIFKEMEYQVIFNDMVSLVVTTVDQTASGAKCLMTHYILPSDVSFE